MGLVNCGENSGYSIVVKLMNYNISISGFLNGTSCNALSEEFDLLIKASFLM